MSRGFWGPVIGLCVISTTGCIDNGVSQHRKDAIAVVLGDFDDITSSLVALDIQTEPWDGFIVQATYDPEDDRLHRGELALQAEGLLTDIEGETDLDNYGTLFVSSGTRGFGVAQYNDGTLPDDGMITDTEPLTAHTCDFANSAGLLVATDWAYDLVEFCWPDAIDFVGDDAALDAAQTGIAGTGVIATVNDEKLKADVGDAVTINYDYSAWAVIESVATDTEVLLSGDVSYQPSSTENATTLTNVPLIVRFPAGNGQVVFSTFHLSAQNPTLQQALLLDGMDGLIRGGGTTTDSGGTSGS